MANCLGRREKNIDFDDDDFDDEERIRIRSMINRGARIAPLVFFCGV